MKARKKPIEVLAFRYRNVIVEEFLKMLNKNPNEPARLDKKTGIIYIKKDRGEIEIKYGDWVIEELNTDGCFWGIQHEIFVKTYIRVSTYLYKKKVYEIEYEELKDLEDKNIIKILDFLGYKSNTPLEILQRDELIKEIKENGSIPINGLEGVLQLYPKEILIKGIEGEFYPVKKENFLKVYDIIG